MQDRPLLLLLFFGTIEGPQMAKLALDFDVKHYIYADDVIYVN